MKLLEPQLDTLSRLQTREVVGSVAAVRGLSLYVDDLPAPVGTLVRLERPRAALVEDRRQAGSHVPRTSGPPLPLGEVAGFVGSQSIVMLYGPTHGISPGTAVVGLQSAQFVQVGSSMLGRVLNGFGQPIDGK